MPQFWTDLDRAYADVHEARAAVDRAQREYSRGGSASAVNSANKRLADAHYRVREANAGRVRDTR